MSRIGKKPVPVPQGVTVEINGRTVKTRGSRGELSLELHPLISARLDKENNQVLVERPDKTQQTSMLQGTMRSLVNNMVIGVSQGYEKRLEVVGVGYQARMQGQDLSLVVGFSNPVLLALPAGVIVELPNPTHITIRGPDKQAVGEFAARVRKVRPPEPFKGKGIRYQGEAIRRKAGKAFVGGEG